ncbi:MAG TPA: YihY/virulence factor BrkB family protein [Actinomycetota bacterium]|nr:YihY/virulence factor BrkB family protein [Actinomycetota bacterium]
MGAQPSPPRGWRAIPTIAARTVRGAIEDRVFGLGGEVAFFLLLSFPPALLAVLGGIAYVAELLGPHVTERIRQQVLDVGGAFLTERTRDELLRPALDSILREARPAVVSLGIVLTLWSASRATGRTMEAVNIAYDAEELRSGWRRRLLALALTVGGMLTIVVVVPVLVAGPGLLEAVARPLGIGEALGAAWRFLYWPIVALLGIGLLASFFHFSTPWRTPWRRDLPGAALAAVAWILGGVALRFYASRFVEGSVFGPLAAPVVFLLWLYVLAVAVLLGAELNAEIEKAWPTSEALRHRREERRRREDRAREEAAADGEVLQGM